MGGIIWALLATCFLIFANVVSGIADGSAMVGEAYQVSSADQVATTSLAAQKACQILRGLYPQQVAFPGMLFTMRCSTTFTLA